MFIAPYVIVCSVDRSEYSPAVIANAFDEARRHDRSIVHFVTIVEPGESTRQHRLVHLVEVEDELRSLVKDGFATFSEWLTPDQKLLRIHVRSGTVDEEVRELALEVRADRIFVGPHGSSGKKRKRGGIPSQLVEDAPCAVVVVRAKEAREHSGEETCTACAFERAESGGEQWFCKEHRGTRSPRLVGRAGSPDFTPGWGLF